MDKQDNFTLTPDDPFYTPIAVQEALMQRAIRDAAKVYKMHGLKMIGGDRDGNVFEVDPDEVLNPPKPQKVAG